MSSAPYPSARSSLHTCIPYKAWNTCATNLVLKAGTTFEEIYYETLLEPSKFCLSNSLNGALNATSAAHEMCTKCTKTLWVGHACPSFKNGRFLSRDVVMGFEVWFECLAGDDWV